MFVQKMRTFNVDEIDTWTTWFNSSTSLNNSSPNSFNKLGKSLGEKKEMS